MHTLDEFARRGTLLSLTGFSISMLACAGAASSGSTGGEPVTGDARSLGAHELPAGCAAPARKYACNPVTNAGCDSVGEACDDDENHGFKCYAPPNDVAEGGDCNVVEGPSCKAGFVCAGATAEEPDGTCRRYCCSSADCNGRSCVPIDAKLGTLGSCG